MIKSKIDARERALELTVEFCTGSVTNSKIAINIAKTFSDFLIGDAELPETQSDTELVKAFLEVMNSELEKKCKPNTPDYGELMKLFQTGNAGIV